MSDFFLDMPKARRAGRRMGITSVCSAHPAVIRATFRHGKTGTEPVLIEATCNQVNQDGGYTGMTPADFRRFVLAIAVEEGFDAGRIIFGGDHLGPNPWRKLAADEALAKAEAMVAAFVAAGFSKIHLDASMGCLGEPEALDDEVTAHRAARLAAAAERAAHDAGLPPPVYVIGTEVPTPGGATHALDHLEPTSAAAAKKTIAIHRAVFAKAGLEAAFARAIGIVVQPGVEFGHESVVRYQPERARALVAVLDSETDFIFEAHSTDYQPVDRLAALVGDGFSILKVGPGLTFALREALYGLDLIAAELDPAYRGRPLAEAMEALMLAEPKNWQSHYPGTAEEQHLLRHYSYSDRIRYYWPDPQAEAAVARLMATLDGRTIPETLVSQFLPRAAGAGPLTAEGHVSFAVEQVLADYTAAIRG
ncbi:D-tagatose-bisphosphate aldolase, class II, non-catalytic subunit [Mesorhizobium sp. BR1-1-16]|uniref:D-tagatose-bisphosphate aldolase, class II, non-catalytic subunit n=1 Tax=Mesorhizobium sp. BR1-1-16 TaxID=2876653 RepID=UPI001CCC25A2|nr:D-tagatose-bisphosphate aldolase, class II, non-catalytic subunit [Mesorhizobium sp. BR1-1-16]MBZ9936783.1 D-tagatose-bisphosphate aldolase, class II, non-catalytic subunit [Mesorhizobium sp. BR1-1-16]